MEDIMFTVNDIRRDSYYGDMVRGAWQDEVYGINRSACESTYHQIMEIICNQMEESHDIIGTLEDLVNSSVLGTGCLKGPTHLNTYPFGEKSDLYREFFGVSVGKIKLKDVFDAAVIHTEACLKQGMHNPTITILTDNYDPKTFAKYEKKFIDYVLNHGVYIYIFLVTDYGISRIPFLCGKNIKQLNGKYNNVRIR